MNQRLGFIAATTGNAGKVIALESAVGATAVAIEQEYPPEKNNSLEDICLLMLTLVSTKCTYLDF